MKLNVYVADNLIPIEVPDDMLEEAEHIYAKMDSDMDKGWKIGPTYIEKPDRIQRAQIAADKMLTAIETENQTLAQLMAGYIVSRIPEVKSVNIDIYGEPLNTEIETWHLVTITNADQ